jgi:hypothetical protein
LPQLSSGPLARNNCIVNQTANAKQCLAFEGKNNAAEIYWCVWVRCFVEK